MHGIRESPQFIGKGEESPILRIMYFKFLIEQKMVDESRIESTYICRMNEAPRSLEDVKAI